MGKLDGKVAIITGAAQGLGATYARAYAKEGAKVAIADKDSGAKVAAEIKAAGGQAIDVPTDVSDEAACNAMVAKTVGAFGRLDILVTNAAISGDAMRVPAGQITVEEWDRVAAVNVRGTWLCCKAAAPEMAKNKYGKIITIASARIFVGATHMLQYDASKGAILGITRSLAREVGNDGIRVNCIAPGLTMSESIKAQLDTWPVPPASFTASRVFKREELPEDLVGAAVFLAAPDSDFMTGQTIVIDGGRMMW
jgi:NAD(P)-dependent dehydrogenase (short-subunit alcohol dehydrogenase family)